MTDTAWAHARIVDTAEIPEESTLDELRLWLYQRSTGQAAMYRNRGWHEFRMLASPKGPIEKLVKALMPLSRLGRIFLVSIYPYTTHLSFCLNFLITYVAPVPITQCPM